MIYELAYNAIPLLGLRIVFAVAIDNHELVIELHKLGQLSNQIDGIALILFLSPIVLVILPANKTK